MKELISEIAVGKRNGETLWIYDVRYENGFGAKPARNIHPTEVLVRSNDVVPDNISYSESHFAPLKNGAPQKKIIKLYDNTGYRSYPGIPVRVFRTEKECRDDFIYRVAVINSELDSWLATQTLIHASIKNILTEALCQRQ